MLHHSHRVPMRQALALIAFMAAGLLLAWAVPIWTGFERIENYVPIHTMLEMVAVVIGVLVFACGWNAYSRALPRHAVVLACAFLGVAMLDFAHALSFVGMPHFITPSGPQKAIHFWLAARLLAASALLLVAMLPPGRAVSGRGRFAWLFGVLLAVAGCYWVFLFHPGWMPETYRPGTGLTAFKIGAEYLIISMNLAAAWLLYMQMQRPLPFNAAALFGAVCAMAMSECFFTLYATLSDVYNFTGHVYKVVSYLFLYRAVFVEVIEEPYREMALMGDQLRATLDAVPDVMLELDLLGRYHAVHSSRPETLIRPPDELLGKTIRDVMPADQALVVTTAMEEALTKGTSAGAQLELELADGPHWFELSVSRKGGACGPDTRFIVLSRDITERKQAESALLERQAMMKASEAKSEFLSRVSHELRTPLNAVIGFAQLLLHDANGRMAAGQRLHVEYILRAGQHLLEMINDILDLTRIESGDGGLTM
ncbi:MAG: PAS domain-containing protein, partial [Aquabacterium sp.]|nr:PAS domain-containing protein [Aquabacterium sp.]